MKVHKNREFSDEQLSTISDMRANGMKIKQIAASMGSSYHVAWYAVKRKGAYAEKTAKQLDRTHRLSIPPSVVSKVDELIMHGHTQRAIAEALQVCQSTVNNVSRRRRAYANLEIAGI